MPLVDHGPLASLCTNQPTSCHADCTHDEGGCDKLRIQRSSLIEQRAWQQVRIAYAASTHPQKLCAQRANPGEGASGLYQTQQMQPSSQLTLVAGHRSEMHLVGHGPLASLCTNEPPICHADCTRGRGGRGKLQMQSGNLIEQRAWQQVRIAYAASTHPQKLCAQRANPGEGASGLYQTQQMQPSSQLTLVAGHRSEMHLVGHGPLASLCTN